MNETPTETEIEPEKQPKLPTIKDEDLVNLPKEELIQLLKDSRKENNRLTNELSKANGPKDKKKDLLRYKSKKSVDHVFQNSIQKKFAIKICYFGAKYYGYASQPHVSETIEEKIFDALKHVLLIKERESCDYSRCGRTDKGVSAFGNVISLKLRAPKPQEKKEGQEEQKKSDQPSEMDYCKMINGCLPPEIRALSCVSVPDEFNARYDCTHRVYKYFFFKQNLDLERMAQAAKRYIGEHDFRNFCKVDVVSTISFKRTIFDVTLEKVEGVDQSVVKDDRLDLYCFTIKGISFLWHQIRCMVSILFMIGRHKEEPEIIDDLLNIEKFPARPQYELAPEQNLVLYDCVFDKVEFPLEYGGSFRVFQHFKNLMMETLLDMGLYANVLNYLSHPVIEETKDGSLNQKRFAIKFLEDEDAKPLAHKKIKERMMAKSVNENVNELKGKKKELYLKKLQGLEAYQARLDNDE